MTPLIAAQGVSKAFLGRKRKPLWAVRGVDLHVGRREIVGLVGESGSGKSTLARLLLRLLPCTSGRVYFEGQEITRASRSLLQSFRKRAQPVFQDAVAALNPRMRVGEIIAEPLRVHRSVARERVTSRVMQLLESVGLGEELLERFPHQLSGGQRQRVGFARALSVGPELIIADEPVSQLDVSVQAQVLELIRELHGDLGLAFLLIAHDLRVVRYLSRRVAVMYCGRILEVAPTEALFSHARHPYTTLLLSATPDKLDEWSASGSGLDTRARAEGCAFAVRCPVAGPECEKEEPALREMREGHWVACWKI